MEIWSTPQSPRPNNRSMQDDKKRSPLVSDDDWEVLNQNDSKHNDHSPTNRREQQQSSSQVEPLQQDSMFFKPTQEQQFLFTNSNLQNQRENDIKMVENQTKTNKASIWPIFPIKEIQYLPQQQNQVTAQGYMSNLMPYQRVELMQQPGLNLPAAVIQSSQVPVKANPQQQQQPLKAIHGEPKMKFTPQPQKCQQPVQQLNPQFEAPRQQTPHQNNAHFEALRKFEALRLRLQQKLQQAKQAQQINAQFEAPRPQYFQQPVQQVNPQFEAHLPQYFQYLAQQGNPEFLAPRHQQSQQPTQQGTREFEASRPRQKMLVLLANGEQRLLNVPFIEEINNVQEVLVQNGIHIKNLEWAIYSNVDIVVTELKFQEDTISSAKPKPQVKLPDLPNVPSNLADVIQDYKKENPGDMSAGQGRINKLGDVFINGRPLPSAIRLKIVELAASGVPPCQISQNLRVSHGCVSKILNSCQEMGSTHSDVISYLKSRIATPDIALKESDFYLSDCGSEQELF